MGNLWLELTLVECGDTAYKREIEILQGSNGRQSVRISVAGNTVVKL
jgi:hypothetical protein